MRCSVSVQRYGDAELDAIRDQCLQRVKRMSWVSAGAAAMPVPLLDLVVDVGVLYTLIPEINERFGLAPEQIDAMSEPSRLQVWKRRAERGSSLIGMVITRTLIQRSLQSFWIRIVTRQVAKFIPLGGQIIAGAMGYWVMRQLAMRHVDDCYEVAAAARGLQPRR